MCYARGQDRRRERGFEVEEIEIFYDALKGDYFADHLSLLFIFIR